MRVCPRHSASCSRNLDSRVRVVAAMVMMSRDLIVNQQLACVLLSSIGSEREVLNRPNFNRGQDSRRIGRYGPCTQEKDLEAVFTRCLTVA